MKRVRITLEMNILEEALKDHNITEKELLKGIFAQEDSIVDGCQVTTDIPGTNRTSDIFLAGCQLISKELIPGPYEDDGRQEYRDAVRADIIANGEMCYGIPAEKVIELTETSHPAVEAITEAVCQRVQVVGQTLDKALDLEVESYFVENPVC